MHDLIMSAKKLLQWLILIITSCPGCPLPYPVHVSPWEPVPLSLREERGSGQPARCQGGGELEGLLWPARPGDCGWICPQIRHWVHLSGHDVSSFCCYFSWINQINENWWRKEVHSNLCYLATSTVCRPSTCARVCPPTCPRCSPTSTPTTPTPPPVQTCPPVTDLQHQTLG